MAKRKSRAPKRRASAKSKVPVFEEVTGHWLFLLGFLIAVILGIMWPSSLRVGSLLVIIGIIVGLFNIKAKEVHSFLLATIALAVAARSFELIPFVGQTVLSIMTYILALVAPAAGVVSVIAIWKLAAKK